MLRKVLIGMGLEMKGRIMSSCFSRSLLEAFLVAVFLFRYALVSPQVVNDDENSVLCLQGIKRSFQHQVSPLDEWDFSNISVGSICNLTGVSCWNTRETRILSLELSSCNLSGQIPESLRYCRSLQSLDLSNNVLSGQIPSQLCTWLPYLVTLDLTRTNLSGSIPPTLGNCSFLNELFLSDNFLSGAIPNELSTLQRLTRLSLESNNLTGQIPANLSINFGRKDFSGNDGLCGQPLEISCGGKRSNKFIIIVSFGVFAAAAAACILLGLWRFKFLGKQGSDGIDHESLHRIPGMPSMFSYNDIKNMTEDFSNKLGQGGFGTVFEGTLADGRKVAVKRLDGTVGRIKDDSFFAEVKSIGSIHHVNLVRLLSFCTEKSHRLLVYEYMVNGSLEKWIFGEEFVLTWQQRKKIIMDIAKGLNYLHVECHQKIIHLDIKPQNILLSDNFDAKVSDFGLSKLIEKDQSRVMTTMRGTPGYLAPEWLHGVITEKVDVYSFGVVVLEIVCGRKVFDTARDEEDRYLLTLLKRKKEEDRLLDIVNISGEELQQTGVEVNDMMKLAAWCLQGDYSKRPSMSMVVKVLEGAMQIEDNLDYNFWYKPVKDAHNIHITHEPTQILASILSAPR